MQICKICEKSFITTWQNDICLECLYDVAFQDEFIENDYDVLDKDDFESYYNE